ncbi:MAG: KpsF/GutQ family sugar-phosphate isomerase [FCB group bacterium]|jgi:arabinose-5-phosphate isomerase
MPFSKENILIEACLVFDNAISSLKETQGKLGTDFNKSVSLICSSKKIFVSGVGKSGIIAKKIAATLTSYGFTSLFLHPVEALHGDIGLAETGDIAILLSKSGSTDDIVRLVPFLKSKKLKLIAIVGNTNSYLASAADYVLDASIKKEACPFNIAPTTSTTVAMAIGDALAVCCAKYKNITLNDFSRNHPLGQIGRNLSLQVKDVMHRKESIPMVTKGATFRDALIEITNKRLGCVFVVDKNLNLKGIITDGDVRRIFQKFESTRGLKVEDVMNANPIGISQDIYLAEALSMMENRESQISVLAVVDSKKKCIGVIRVHDIIRSGI